ncbi:hypothetical protein [Methylobacterium komagatae]
MNYRDGGPCCGGSQGWWIAQGLQHQDRQENEADLAEQVQREVTMPPAEVVAEGVHGRSGRLLHKLGDGGGLSRGKA